jgi:protein-S-isoprenylcysteine O-methyltransferase Ste14
MDLYGKKSKSIPQKVIIVAIEMLLLWWSYRILFMDKGTTLLSLIGIDQSAGNFQVRVVIFAFSVIVFLRMTFLVTYLLKRKIPWEESMSVPFAFALYFIGYALLGYGRASALDWIDFLAIFLFIVGSFLNTASELQRHFWKKRPENKGKLFTRGLFGYAMHINYFGDLLWVSAYAIITRNLYAILIPIFLFCLFVFFNIPKLDAYLSEKYSTQFDKYRRETKRFIPFIY